MKPSSPAPIAVGRQAPSNSRRAKRPAARIAGQVASKGGATPTRDQILRRIRKLYRRGESLRREDVERQDPILERAAARSFGAWRDAVEAAGIPVRGYERWDKERVISEIRELHRRGDHLAHSRAPSQLVEAGISYFGTWRGAVETAGLDYESVQLGSRSKSPDEVIALLQEGARTGRTGVGPDGFITAQVRDLARSKFGSLQAAIAAAGLDATRLLRKVKGVRNERTTGGKRGRPRVADEALAAELQRLVREQPDMTRTEFNKTAVHHALMRRYDTVDAALAAFGISGWPRLINFPLPSPEETVAAIQERHRRGDPMAVVHAMVTERRLVKAAYKWFGTWRSAVRAAGLGVHVDDKLWDRSQVRAELNARRMRGEANDERTIQQDDPRLWSEIMERYSSLAAALRDAARARSGSSSNR